MKRYRFLDLSIADAGERADIAEAVARVIDSGRFVGGEEVDRFEKRLASLTGTELAVGVSNGLDALRLSLRALMETGRLKKGDGVAVQANTYIASVLAITDSGLVPYLIDVDLHSMIPTAENLEEAARNGVKAFMPVHLYGRPAWNAELSDVARRYGLIVIEDNAQAIGATVVTCPEQRRVTTGAIGHIAAFSFYPTKNIGAIGDAGAVTTSDPQLAATVRALANYGSDRRYHNIYRGFNCRLDPIQAAVLSLRLQKLEVENERRRKVAGVYSRIINQPDVVKPEFYAGSVWHQYVITHPDRDRFRAWLGEMGVETDIHYAVPPHRQPCYADLPEKDLFPVTDRLASTMVSLPIGKSTSTDDAEEIAAIINQFE